MEEIAELVLLEGPDVFGNDVLGRHVAHLECVRVQILPVLDRYTSGVEELEIRAEGAARVRDRLIARRAGRDAAAQDRNACEPVASLAGDIDSGCSGHAATQTF